jgi:hypothetical protein
MKHPGHTYGGFVPTISERGMTLENPRRDWVVIIGLELLSLARPALSLGSKYVHQLCLCHPINMMVVLILLV